MLNRHDLKEYRTRRGLSLRDVARYCDVTYQMISYVETGEWGLTESTYREIVKGINAASMAKVQGTFEEDKEKERLAEQKKEEETAKKKSTTPKKTTKKAVSQKKEQRGL